MIPVRLKGSDSLRRRRGGFKWESCGNGESSKQQHWLPRSSPRPFFQLALFFFVAIQVFLYASSLKGHQEEVVLEQISCQAAIRPFCEDSGDCQVVDVSASGWWYRRYPGLLNAQVDISKVQQLDKTELQNKHLRIRTIDMFLEGCGFFTFPLIVLNQLLVAHRHGLIGTEKKPIVYMPENHHYFDAKCSDSSTSPSDNMSLTQLDSDFWETWFEPVGDKSWRDIKEDDVWEFSQASIQTIYYDPDGIHAYPYNGKYDYGTPEWIDEQRSRALEIMEEFNFGVNADLVEESKKQFRDLVGGDRPVVGLHMRGTDKFVTGKVDVAEYDFQVDRFLGKNVEGTGVVFLATDDQEYLDHMTERYGEKVRHLVAMRERQNVLYNDDVDKDIKSKEAVLDMLALSWVDTIVKGWSGVSEFAVYIRQARENAAPFTSIVDLQLFDGGNTHTRDKEDMKMFDAMYKGIESDQELIRVRFLPDELSGRPLEIEDSLYQSLEAELDALTAEDCKGPELQLNFVEWGLGSTLNSLVKPVQHGIKYGNCLREPVGWKKFNCSSWDTLFTPFGEARQASVLGPAAATVNLPTRRARCQTM